MRAVQAAAFSEKRLYPGTHIRKRLSRQVQESNNATTSSVVQTQSTTDLNNQTSSSITASTSVLISTSTSTGSNSATALTGSLATSSTASSTASLTTTVSSTSTSTSTTTSSSTSTSTTETTSSTTTTTASDLEPTADVSRKGTFRPAANVAPAPAVSSTTTTAQTTSASTESQTTNQNPGNQDQSQQTQNSPAAQNGASNQSQDQSNTQPQNNKGNAGGDNQTGSGSQQSNGNSGNDGQQGSGNSGNDTNNTTSTSSTSSDLPVATAVSSNVDAAQAGGNGSGNSQQDGGNGSGSQGQQQGNAGGNGSSSASSTSSADATITVSSSTLDGGNFAATSTLVSSGAPSSTNTSEAGSATLSTSKAQIAGVTVGALALVALVTAVLFFVVRRWRNNRGKVFDPEGRSPSPKRLTTNTIHSFLGSAPVTARLTVPATYNAPPQIMTEFDGRPLSFGPSTTASLNGAGVGAGMAIGSPSQMRQPAQLPRHDSLTIPGHSGNPYSPSPSPVRSPASPASTIEPQFDFVTPPPMYIQTVTAKNYPAPSQSPTRSFNSQTIDFGYTSGPGNGGPQRYSNGSDQVVISPEQHDPFRDQDPFVDPQVRSQPGGLWLQRSLQ